MTPEIQNHQTIIEAAFENRDTLDFTQPSVEIKNAIDAAIKGLDNGSLRVASKENGVWQVHQWLKKAVLLSFRLYPNRPLAGAYTQYYDKVPSKFANWSQLEFEQSGIRIVPPAVARAGCYIAQNTILMPSYVNLGAYIDEGTMVDTWATVGSCAQIGKNVHLAGGVGIGGVLEPLQANPTIIEDDCFIGSRSQVVEGVIIEQGSVLSMGVSIGQSTKIYDRTTGETYQGRVPAGSVVVAGTLPSKDGRYALSAAIIVKRVDEQTRSKVGLNEILRQANEEIHG